MTAGPGRRGIPFVVSGPSGTGKTTLCRAVIERDSEIVDSVSYTTRVPRGGERDGVHYHFVSVADFRRMEREGAFLEAAEYGSNLYGTSAQALDEALSSGVDLLLEIDIQGARQIRERRADARLIFLLPPSLEALERRLRGRRSDPSEAVGRRLALVGRELRAAAWFDYVVINDELEEAIASVLEILQRERAGEPAALLERFGREAVLKRIGARFDISG